MTYGESASLPELDHTLGLAEAMTERNIAEGMWQHDILAETLAMPPIESLALLRRMQTGMTLVALSQIESPDTPTDPSRVFDALFDNESIAEALRAQGVEPTDEEITAARDELRERINLFEMWQGDNPLRLSALREELDAARTVARESGAHISEVYRQDELYSALVLTMESAQAFAIRGLARIADAAELRPDLPEAERAYARLVIEELARYWGEEAWEQIDPVTRLQLQLKAGNV